MQRYTQKGSDALRNAAAQQGSAAVTRKQVTDVALPHDCHMTEGKSGPAVLTASRCEIADRG